MLQLARSVQGPECKNSHVATDHDFKLIYTANAFMVKFVQPAVYLTSALFPKLAGQQGKKGLSKMDPVEKDKSNSIEALWRERDAIWKDRERAYQANDFKQGALLGQRFLQIPGEIAMINSGKLDSAIRAWHQLRA